MIQIERIEVRGQSDADPFEGVLTLAPGLQVVSARNAYGKSLAVKAVAWCLGIEPIFGIPDNEPTCFPQAVREEVEFAGRQPARILSSECSISIIHDDGRHLMLTRAIRGDCKMVRVEERAIDGQVRKSKLLARRETMQDEHGGLQRFLFEWLGWPRQAVVTFRGNTAEIYLENLASAFYIDQDEGWTNIQTLQIGRYGQQQISELAVEYLLGSIDAVKARVARQQTSQRNAYLREAARGIAERVSRAFLQRGWRVEWSGNGSLKESRRGNQEEVQVSDEQLHASGTYHRPNLQGPLAGRAVLQVDQAAPANQVFLWRQRERCKDPDLDRSVGLCARRHRPEALGPGDQPLPESTDFERDAF